MTPNNNPAGGPVDAARRNHAEDEKERAAHDQGLDGGEGWGRAHADRGALLAALDAAEQFHRDIADIVGAYQDADGHGRHYEDRATVLRPTRDLDQRASEAAEAMGSRHEAEERAKAAEARAGLLVEARNNLAANYSGEQEAHRETLAEASRWLVVASQEKARADQERARADGLAADITRMLREDEEASAPDPTRLEALRGAVEAWKVACRRKPVDKAEVHQACVHVAHATLPLFPDDAAPAGFREWKRLRAEVTPGPTVAAVDDEALEEAVAGAARGLPIGIGPTGSYRAIGRALFTLGAEAALAAVLALGQAFDAFAVGDITASRMRECLQAVVFDGATRVDVPSRKVDVADELRCAGEDLAAERKAHGETRYMRDEAVVLARRMQEERDAAKWADETRRKAGDVLAQQRDTARARLAEVEKDLAAPCDRCGHGKLASWKALESERDTLAERLGRVVRKINDVRERLARPPGGGDVLSDEAAARLRDLSEAALADAPAAPPPDPRPLPRPGCAAESGAFRCDRPANHVGTHSESHGHAVISWGAASLPLPEEGPRPLAEEGARCPVDFVRMRNSIQVSGDTWGFSNKHAAESVVDALEWLATGAGWRS